MPYVESYVVSFLWVLPLLSCEDSQSNAICQCYEQALNLDGQALRDEVIACGKQRDQLKQDCKDNPEALAYLTSATDDSSLKVI